ncbi:hypothetical protein ABT063_48530 [Streptomyces sp. NPDC002838]|uniref:hypothetical protein n=1 Tax=Streptomyces sp. NPDC002838 TaxID=3154436 RepID=UPI003325581D
MPLTYASSRLGQVRAMRYGVGLLVGFTAPTVPGTAISMVVTSVGYAAFAVNALVALWGLAPSRHVLGTYTGLPMTSTWNRRTKPSTSRLGSPTARALLRLGPCPHLVMRVHVR